jgi:hypothetical protein
MIEPDDICTWSDLPASQCAHCLDHDGPEPGDVIRWFDARFASPLGCGHYAIAGQTIGLTTGGEYTCRRCGT